MKRIFFLAGVIQLLAFPWFVYAQVAKIVDIQGRVEVKKTIAAPWVKAKANMYLEKQAEIKTAKNSECVLAFDENLENIITVKELSHITIENVKPASLFLPKGRVFSLIENLAKLDKFEVRTPTAIAGVRGTGDSVESDDKGSVIKCFQGSLWVTGISGQGRQDDPILNEGEGLSVDSEGNVGNPFGLGPEDYDEWDDFIDYTDSLRKEQVEGDGSEEGLEDTGGATGLDELEDESVDSISDDGFEDLRKESEDKDNGSGGYGEVLGY